jgi:hypothetical protein
MVVSINAKTDIHVEPMTAAQRQAKYRERRKAEEQALLAKTCGFERMTPISSRLKSAGHAVNQRAPTMHPSVSPGIPRSRAAALVRRAICVAVLSEENQKLMPLVPCSTPGGMLKVSERPSVDRADAAVLQHVTKSSKGRFRLLRRISPDAPEIR